MLRIKDTRGRESTTLGFVLISWLITTAKFAAAGLTIPSLGTMPEMTAGAYAAAFGVELTIWLGREWTEKNKNAES